MSVLTRLLRWYGLPFLLLALVVPVYLDTLASGVMPEDAGEFQTRFYTLEPTHPTGYPLLIILGKLWVTLWPLGSVADRGNLLAALFSIGAVLTGYTVVVLLTKRPLAGFFASLALAFTPSLWFYSTKAGSYPFHIFLVGLSWWTVLRWQQGKGRLSTVACVVGMGLAHHRMFLMVLPALGLFILLQDPAILRRGRQFVALALLAALPFLSYLLLPLRGIWPLPRFLSHALLINSPMGGLVFPVRGMDAWWQRWREVVWPNLVDGLGPAGLLLGLLGFALLALWPRWPGLSRRPGSTSSPCKRLLVSAACLLLVLAHVVFFLAYVIVPDDRRYYAPVDFVLSVGSGLAAAWLLGHAQRLRRPVLAWAWRGGLVLALLALPAWEAHQHRPVVDQEHGRFVTALTREGLAAVETGAAIIGSAGYVTTYWYYQRVEGWRPDVTVYMDGATIGREQAVALIEDDHAVYFRDPLYGLDRSDSDYTWLSFGRGGLDRALAHPLTPVWTVEANHSFRPDLRLVGAAASAAPLRPDDFVALWLRWESEAPVPETIGLSVWLEDEAGRRWWQWDKPWRQAVGAITASGVASTTHPLVASTTHYLVVPAGMPPGRYRWNVLIYDDQGNPGEPWEAEATVERPTLSLSPGRFPLSHPLPEPWVVGPIAMLGHRRPEEPVMAGSSLSLSFLWRALDTPSADWQMQLRIEGAGHQEETPLSPLVRGYSTCQWQADDLFLGYVPLRVPANWPGGRYQLTLEVHGPQGMTAYPLRPLHIAERPVLRRVPDAIQRREDRLGEAIRLLGYDVQPQAVRPGETVVVTLYWQAVGAPGENYKVFNHLVGAGGFLAGQQDGLPGGGTVLSSEWVRGEVVVDRYEIGVQEGSPPGEYVLYTGMYQPDDGLRLDAWDGANNRWLNDMIALDTVSVTTR
jgi:hypothetical protein